MTNTDELRKLIKKKGLKYGYIAVKLDISPFGLQKKIDNITEFKTSEVQTMCEILGISDDLKLKEKLFFVIQVD